MEILGWGTENCCVWLSNLRYWKFTSIDETVQLQINRTVIRNDQNQDLIDIGSPTELINFDLALDASWLHAFRQCPDRKYLVPLKQNTPIICCKWLVCLTRLKMTSSRTTRMHPNHRLYHSQHKSYNAETPRLAVLKVDRSYQVGLCTEVVKLLLD